jgi:hypothetical protein
MTSAIIELDHKYHKYDLTAVSFSSHSPDGGGGEVAGGGDTGDAGGDEGVTP